MRIFKTDFMKPYLLFQLVILLISLDSMGQELFNSEKLPQGNYPGYVVTRNHDTIFGEIIVETSFYKLCKEVEFIDRNNQITKYSPDDLLAFHFGNTHFIGNTWVFTHSDPSYGLAFIQQLVDGYLKYYKYFHYELASYGPILTPKLSEEFYYSYGRQKPNPVSLFKELLSVTWDRKETYDTIFNRKFEREDMPKILYNYNCWLSNSGMLIEKRQLDSLYASTKLDLEAAFDDSLLLFRNSDKNFYEYLHRILYYASNTIDYKGYTIYENKDDFGRTLSSGLKVNANKKFMKIGTWRYYHESDDNNGDLQIKMEETYDYNGRLHGIVSTYDKKGNIIGTTTYTNGKKIKKH